MHFLDWICLPLYCEKLKTELKTLVLGQHSALNMITIAGIMVTCKEFLLTTKLLN